MTEEATTPGVARVTHPVVKAASAAGVMAFLIAIWNVASPLLPEPTVKVIQPWVQKVADNSEKIQEVVDQITQLKDQITQIKVPPKVVTPTPSPTPSVDHTIKDLQDQIKNLTEVIQSLQHPPSPTVVTPPAPVTPSAITAHDAQGKAITSTVEPGRQFFITATVSGTWTILKTSPEDVDAKVFGDEVSVVLRNGAAITVVHSAGNPITTSSLMIRCNTGPMPPPVVVTPPVTPPVTPAVDPTAPKAGDLRVLIVFESSQNHTREQLSVLNSTALVSALDAKCVKEDGLPAWRRWDKNTAKDTSTTMGKLWQAVLPEAVAKGLPAMVICCGTQYTTYGNGQFPKTEADAIALLTCAK